MLLNAEAVWSAAQELLRGMLKAEIYALWFAPVRAAQAMVLAAEHPHPPRHLVLGAIGTSAVVGVLQRTLAEIETWRATSVGADFPAP